MNYEGQVENTVRRRKKKTMGEERSMSNWSINMCLGNYSLHQNKRCRGLVEELREMSSEIQGKPTCGGPECILENFVS